MCDEGMAVSWDNNFNQAIIRKLDLMKVEMKGSAVSIALVLPIYGTTKF